MQPSWRLDDAEVLAAANPYTFYRPSPAGLQRLGPGDFAKLIFAFDSDDPDAPGAERMWVRIVARTGDAFEGVLDNEPRAIRDLAHGAPIAFGSRHVIQMSVEDPVADPTERFRPRCFVTQRVLRDGAPVVSAYREAPEEPQDSGWRFTAGDEPEGYFDDADNVAYVSLGAVLRRDDRVLGLLDTPAPCAFAWDPVAGAFRAEAPPGADDGGET